MQNIQEITFELIRYILINYFLLGIILSTLFLIQFKSYLKIHRLFGVFLFLLSIYYLVCLRNFIKVAFLPNVDFSCALILICLIGPAYYFVVLSIGNRLKALQLLHIFPAIIIGITIRNYIGYFNSISNLAEFVLLIYMLIYGMLGRRILSNLRNNNHAIFGFYLLKCHIFYKCISVLIPSTISISLMVKIVVNNQIGEFISGSLIAIIYYYTIYMIVSHEHPILDGFNNNHQNLKS